MFVTFNPGRVVGAGKTAIASGSSVVAGTDGLFSKIRITAENITVSTFESNDDDGYIASSGETIEFSGKIKLYNGGSSSVTVYFLTFDTI